MLGVARAQSIEAKPSNTEVGASVRVKATQGSGAPLVGAEVHVRRPGAQTEEAVGQTGADGTLAFEPDAPGAYRLRIEVDGVDVMAPLYANEARSRLWIALVCVPLGLWLIVRNVRPRTRRA